MTYSPLLIVHICGGILGVLSGGVALFVRKGSRLHRRAGNVFVIAMLARLNPLGVVPAAIFLAAVMTGAAAMSRATGDLSDGRRAKSGSAFIRRVPGFG